MRSRLPIASISLLNQQVREALEMGVLEHCECSDGGSHFCLSAKSRLNVHITPRMAHSDPTPFSPLYTYPHTYARVLTPRRPPPLGTLARKSREQNVARRASTANGQGVSRKCKLRYTTHLHATVCICRHSLMSYSRCPPFVGKGRRRRQGYFERLLFVLRHWRGGVVERRTSARHQMVPDILEGTTCIVPWLLLIPAEG